MNILTNIHILLLTDYPQLHILQACRETLHTSSILCTLDEVLDVLRITV